MQSSCKNSGQSIVFNVDPYSMEKLRQAQDWYELNGRKVSGGLIVRRAVRMYIEHLITLTTRDMKVAEGIEIDRARKGVL